MKEYLTIFINGEAFNCCNEMSLEEVLIYFDFNLQNIVIEYNKEIIVKDKLSATFLLNNDKVEVITIVGGG
uniref:Thiamin biosynthesis protein S n=1 Tax=Spermothamnion repens TaxID=31383 RepID=A0A4D6WYW5_9FLOR|nr:Thiamin biosynthesis protein S [Spermothamnion repens]